MDDRWKELIGAARQATSRARAPYSGLAVGAAVLTSNGETFVGSNVENASYGLSICAERVAIFKAVTELADSDVDTLIEAVVAVDSQGRVLSPCGSCRQVILEFGANAEVLLPSGSQPIAEALAEPFEKLSLVDKVTPPIGASRDGAAIAGPVAAVLGLSEENRVLLMRLLGKLREGAANLYKATSLERTRSVLFVSNGDYLVIPPGFFCNFDNPEERTIEILVGHGITGGAVASRQPNFGVPCSDGELHSDPLPSPQQDKVDPKLKWVVAWPLGRLGAVSVDGFDAIETGVMREISRDEDLKRVVDRIEGALPR